MLHNPDHESLTDSINQTKIQIIQPHVPEEA